MVRIHGQWCGPNWTQGKKQPANAPGVDFTAPCDDKLDCACRAHDKDCASDPRGCSKKGDQKLIDVALKEALNPINRIFNPAYADKAAAVAAGIQIAQLTRRR
jgi:hypothetical protein